MAIALDPLTIPRTEEQKKVYENLSKIYNFQIIPYISRLQEAHNNLKEILQGRKVDFLFIDGGHSYDDVKHDFFAYLQYMNNPSVIGFHDIYYSDQLSDSGHQVSFFWERIKRLYVYDEFCFHSSMGIGLIYYPSKRKDMIFE